jgi:hypothetical protein
VSRDTNAPGPAGPTERERDRNDGSARIAREASPEVQLAREFLEEIAGRPEPWSKLLLPWAAARGVTVDQLKALQREVIRQRVFGAMARYQPRRRA